MTACSSPVRSVTARSSSMRNSGSRVMMNIRMSSMPIRSMSARV